MVKLKQKKGSQIFLILMMGIICFILGSVLVTALSPVVYNSMHSTELNCTSVTTYQDKAVCTQMDMFVPLLTGILFGLAGMLLAGVAIQ